MLIGSAEYSNRGVGYVVSAVFIEPVTRRQRSVSASQFRFPALVFQRPANVLRIVLTRALFIG